MQEYLEISTSSDREQVNLTCLQLEERGIGFMLEHVSRVEFGKEVAAYRVLVPREFFQAAVMVAGVREFTAIAANG